MTDIDFSRSFGSAAWALARVCCVGFLFLGSTNCLPASPDDTGGTGGGNSSTGGNGGNSSSSHSSQASVPPSGGGNTYASSSTPSGGGNTYASTSHSSTASGGNTYASSSSKQSGGGNPYASTSSSTQSGGGNTYASSTSAPPTGGTTTSSSPPPTGGTPSSTPTGTTVTFAAGKAQGAMVGYGWVALGSLDSITDPKCGAAAITAAAPCTTSTTWSSASALCVTGNVPALGTPPDYTNNWGLSVGGNANATAGTGLGQSFTSITIAVTGTPTSGLRAMVHRSGDPDATSYCYALTPGTAIPLTSFSATCYTSASPGTAITAADVPKIDKISVQVSSGTTAIPVPNLCITGITFQ